MGSDFDFTIVGPALLAGMLVLSTHVPLGKECLSAALSLSIWPSPRWRGRCHPANNLGWEAHGWEVQLVAVGGHARRPQPERDGKSTGPISRRP